MAQLLTACKPLIVRLFPYLFYTDDEKRVAAMGAKAFEEMKEHNPYPRGTTRHAAWQAGYDNAENTAISAW